MYFLFELHCNHFFILYLVIEKSSNTSFIFGLSKFVLTFTLIFGRITKHPPCPPRSWPTKLAWQHFATRICLCNNSYDNVGGGSYKCPLPISSYWAKETIHNRVKVINLQCECIVINKVNCRWVEGSYTWLDSPEKGIEKGKWRNAKM